MEEKFVELLSSIGLSQNEIDVYLDLLKNSASTAYSVANRIDCHRSSVYEAIKKLHQIGFIVEIQEENRKLYQTREYTAIEEYLRQKQSEFKEIEPYLKTISNTEMPEGSISISYGSNRLRAAFSELFRLKKEILIWTLPKRLDEFLGRWFLKEMEESIQKKEIMTKIISSSEFKGSNEIPKNNFTEVRYSNEESNIFTIVCSDTVLLIVLSSPATIVEMKNANISEGFKSRFLTLWEKSEVA